MSYVIVDTLERVFPGSRHSTARAAWKWWFSINETRKRHAFWKRQGFRVKKES